MAAGAMRWMSSAGDGELVRAPDAFMLTDGLAGWVRELDKDSVNEMDLLHLKNLGRWRTLELAVHQSYLP